MKLNWKTRAMLREVYISVASDMADGITEFICVGIDRIARRRSINGFNQWAITTISKSVMAQYYKPLSQKSNSEQWWHDHRRPAEKRRHPNKKNHEQRILALLFMAELVKYSVTVSLPKGDDDEK